MRRVSDACAVAAMLAAMILTASPSLAGDEQLRITVVDGQVIFAGANLDLDELRAALARTGRQGEVLTFQVGPNAKSAYITRVLKAVRDAGYSKLSIVGPDGGPPVGPTIDPSQRFD